MQNSIHDDIRIFLTENEEREAPQVKMQIMFCLTF